LHSARHCGRVKWIETEKEIATETGIEETAGLSSRPCRVHQQPHAATLP
jgi:hypothetical protein